jgi:hypothetical protein
MDLSSKDVCRVLSAKDVKFIHHANSVITSCQFLRHGALLSRGTIERSGLYQTPQMSDRIDKKCGLWFDVFADSVDIHARARCANLYGPTLFVLDVELLRRSYTGRLWITKLNPTKWQGTSREDRWFSSIGELEDGFVKGEFDQMVVFRHSGGEVPFKSFLSHVLLDDPKLQTSGKSGIDLYSMAYGALKFAATEGGLKVKITKRTCASACKCLQHYRQNKSSTVKMYAPKA